MYPSLQKYRVYGKGSMLNTISRTVGVEFEDPKKIEANVEELCQWLIQNERLVLPHFTFFTLFSIRFIYLQLRSTT